MMRMFLGILAGGVIGCLIAIAITASLHPGPTGAFLIGLGSTWIFCQIGAILALATE